MPHIKNVIIESDNSVLGSPGSSNFDVVVRAEIGFSEVEQNLAINYNTRIALYEIDDTMDVYSVFPNGAGTLIQRASRGDKDDFLGFSSNKAISAQAGNVTIEHQFSVRATLEPDRRMKLKALVVCTPDTATAMKWSGTKFVEVIVG